MIFNMSGGGSENTMLNLHIVGGTERPINPRENTIWANTPYDITKWAFGVENPYIGVHDVNLAEGITLAEGYLTEVDTVVEKTDGIDELYTEDYIPVSSGDEDGYHIMYTLSSNNLMWLAICEYTVDNVFVRRTVLCNEPNTAFTYNYHPEDDIRSIRLTWYSYNSMDVDCNISFVDKDVPIPIEQGVVWFPTASQSTSPMNILKNNNITIYPYGANQYVNGEWVSVAAEAFTKGTWWLWELWLYSYGEEYFDLTGGWTEEVNCRETVDGVVYLRPYAYSGNAADPNAVFIRWFPQTRNKIDITNFNSIVLNIQYNPLVVHVWLSTTEINYNTLANAEYHFNTENKHTGEWIIDVSDISGSYYFVISVSDGASRIASIKLA